MIKLLILDVDGVFTDGRKLYSEDGLGRMKSFCDKDFTAIKRLKGAGVKVCILSGDDFIHMAMAENRNIDFYSARGKDKADFIPGFVKTYGANPDEMVYIGDDLFDKSVMEAVGHAFCPADSCADIRDVCGSDNTLDNNGGCNAVAEMVDIMLQRKMIPDATMQQIEDLDKKEKF